MYYPPNKGKITYTSKCVGMAFTQKKLNPYFKTRGIVPNKTIHAITTLPSVTDDLTTSLIMGFIDGDGNIARQTYRKDAKLALHIHSNWLYFLKACKTHIDKLTTTTSPEPKLANDGYASWIITNRRVLRKLYQEVQRLKLPVLKRKWSILSHLKLGRIERSELLIAKAKQLRDQNYTNTAIAEELNVPYYRVEGWMYRKRLMRRRVWQQLHNKV